MLTLEAATPQHLSELLAFELDNRAFFERHINARPADYYSEAGVLAALESAQRDAEAGTGHQYLLRDAAGALVGRINLSRVRRAHFHSAELGYRIAESAAGRGHATRAVALVLDRAFGELGLRRLEATARPENIGSVTVLQRNGFRCFGQSTRSFELGGRWFDLMHFERHAGD